MNYFLKPWYNELSQHKTQAIAFSSNVVFFPSASERKQNSKQQAVFF